MKLCCLLILCMTTFKDLTTVGYIIGRGKRQPLHLLSYMGCLMNKQAYPCLLLPIKAMCGPCMPRIKE